MRLKSLLLAGAAFTGAVAVLPAAARDNAPIMLAQDQRPDQGRGQEPGRGQGQQQQQQQRREQPRPAQEQRQQEQRPQQQQQRQEQRQERQEQRQEQRQERQEQREQRQEQRPQQREQRQELRQEQRQERQERPQLPQAPEQRQVPREQRQEPRPEQREERRDQRQQQREQRQDLRQEQRQERPQQPPRPDQGQPPRPDQTQPRPDQTQPRTAPQTPQRPDVRPDQTRPQQPPQQPAQPQQPPQPQQQPLPQQQPDRQGGQRDQFRQDGERRDRDGDRRDGERRDRDGERRDRVEDRGRRLEDVRGERRERREGNRTIIEEGSRTIVREGDRVIIRRDESERFRRLGRDVNVQRIGGEIRTVVVGPRGERIVTVTDANGRLIRRSRFVNNREVVIIDNRIRGPRRADTVFVTLPPPVIRIPRERYIVDAGDAPREYIYDALMAPPVEPIPRRYTLDEIRYSPAIRDRMPRVDLDTINFDTGSWEVTPDQYDRLAPIADGIKRAISQNPNEVFLIEGHTDAVGSDEDNLSLSDRRAESVSVILTDEFQVPPENLVTQGYGEQQLKVPTDGPERANRRVTIRRITPLLQQGQAAAGPGAPPVPRR